MNQEVRICDTTLREGSQTPYVNYSIKEKLEVLSIIQDLGIKILELGFPVSSEFEIKFIKEAFTKNKIKKDVEILLMCRANLKEVDYIKAFLDNIKISPKRITLLIFTATSDYHLKYKLAKSLTKDKNPSLNLLRKINSENIGRVINHAKKYGFKIDFGIEDASRTSLKYLIKIIMKAKINGAFRFTYADTVGGLTPDKTKEIIERLRKEFPKMEMAIHFHNDRGLALANTIEAIKNGTEVVHTTINGIGERAGNVKLHELLAVLDLYNIKIKNINLKKIYPASKKISLISNIPISPIEPIIGENAFTHKAGIHIHSFLKNKKTYQSLSPELFGRNAKLIFGPVSGKHAIKYLMKELKRRGIKDNENALLNFLKNSKKDYYFDELIKVFK